MGARLLARETGLWAFSLLAGSLWLALAGGPACGQGRMLLKSGFEGEVRVTPDMADLTGIDPDTGYLQPPPPPAWPP